MVEQETAHTRDRRAFLRSAALWGSAAVAVSVAPRPSVGLDLLRDVMACKFESAEELIRITRRKGVRVLDRRGNFVAAFGNYYAPAVSVQRLPKHLINALIVEEDRRFREHGGLDYRGLARGIVETVQGNTQGGSTITQQVLKNTCFRSQMDSAGKIDTIWRKFKEVFTAGSLEGLVEKEGVLNVYLNSVLFGGLRDGAQIYGIQAAARAYFGKYAEELSLLESAMLIQLLNAPNALNPWVAPERARQQAERLIDDMVEHGVLTARLARSAKRSQTIVRPTVHGRPGFIPGDVRTGWLAAYVRREAEGRLAGSDAAGVTTVTSTLWPEMQDIVQEETTSAFRAHGRRLRFDQVAAVVMTHQGDVLAMVGGTDFPRLQWNNATQAKRQPGSAFKLFVYLAAFERGMSPTDRQKDAPLQLSQTVIRNHDDKYLGPGPITLAEAFASSSNPVAVRLALGHVPEIVAVAQRLGVGSPLTGEVGLALGVSEVTLLELTAAYATVANRGLLVKPNCLVEIRDNSNLSAHCRVQQAPQRVIKPSHVAMLKEVMTRVVKSGTGSGADPGFFAAGKTGTTDEYVDAWFIGFTDRYVAGVWLGNEKPAPMAGVSGSGLPANIWRNIMVRAHRLGSLSPTSCVGLRSRAKDF